MAKEANWK
ncbi:Protein of unknown function [Bacillus thuringiensis]|uniref:Uncharacterized protein n=1 Tax=Bacillus thuringiensis TaxID=1428 RepID=A0A1C4BD44_BACTU|nr:Protein of unknown function [Bacillus thuringiensis]SCL87621.1 Protein of unknown function [Bacillus wiedmannii]SCN06048.1 Protein of unknown function [Bacillus wiedmannii]